MLLRLMVVSLLATVVFGQSVPNPAFQDPAVIPSFHRRNPEIVYFKTFYKELIDERHLLLAVRGGAPIPGWTTRPDHLIWEQGDLLGIFLMDATNADLVWEIAMIPGPHGEVTGQIVRADAGSVVISRAGNYGMPLPWLKLFFSVVAKQETGRQSYTPPAVGAITAREGNSLFVAQSEHHPLVYRLTGEEVKDVTGVDLEGELDPSELGRIGMGRRVSGALSSSVASAISPFGPGDVCSCDDCPFDDVGRWRLDCTRRLAGSVVDTIAETESNKTTKYRLPSTSFEVLAAARPERVKSGYGRDAANRLDEIGPHQLVGDRLWFAKLFYDGEGLTGVGGLGYFDLNQKQFTMFAPPEIVDWSASAILVRDDAVWVGLVRHPEGATYSGGLLRFDRATERAELFPIPYTILELKSSESGTLAGTTNGLYIVRPGRTVHLSIEPDVKGQWKAFTTVLPSRAIQP